MASHEDLWARAGDVGRAGLLLSAVALPLCRRDFNAGFDALTAIFACAAVSKAVKAWWDEPRPNGEDNKSFPSQHAAECFAAGVALARNDSWGGPALVAAAAVAATRLLARKHHPLDVVAGAGLGITASGLLVANRDSKAVFG